MRKKVFVLLGQPKPQSFCHAIADAAIKELSSAGHEIIYHDLHSEHFDPRLEIAELLTGEKADSLIERHCREVLESEAYVIIHPIWWSQPPALVTGWVDRVFRRGLVYRMEEGGPHGMLRGRKALVLNTSNLSGRYQREVLGDPLEVLWKNCIFGFCGVDRFIRRNFDLIVRSTNEERRSWLNETRLLVRSMISES